VSVWQAAAVELSSAIGSVDVLPPIVSAAWLLEHLDDVVVCEVRSTMAGPEAFDAYLERHIAGARFVSLDDALATPPRGTDGRHPLPSPDQFAVSLGSSGIGNDDVVIAYDDRGGAFAGRLVWMLRMIGQPAALLDGGASGWDGPVESGEPTNGPVDRRAIAWPADRIVDADEVVAHVAAGGVVVDSRERARYLGETEPIDRIAGHVPGAINLPYADNLTEGVFQPPDRLAARFAALCADPRAIVYCGSGVTACHNALAIEAAGFPPPRVYVGSWSGWTADPTRPVATGPNP
jgi:thiosulfate/3-mercaptopyruvate sulfurtransferase